MLGGRPPAYPDEPTDWDAAGGFQAGDDVVAVRHEEDRAAMAVLGAEPVWLDFADHQYLAKKDRPTPAEVAPVLEAAILAVDTTAVFLPMGLANPDHVMTHDAGRIVLEGHPGLAWFCYEDHGYKHIPGMLAWRVSKMFRAGLWPTPALVPLDLDMQRKRKAIYCYTSQIGPLEHRPHAERTIGGQRSGTDVAAGSSAFWMGRSHRRVAAAPRRIQENCGSHGAVASSISAVIFCRRS